MKQPRFNLAFAALILSMSILCAWAQVQSSANAVTTNPSKIDAEKFRTFVQLARSDIKTQKALVMAQNLPLTDDEAVEFWPLHHDYEDELSKINDQKFALIKRYADTYNNLSEKDAAELAKSSFDLEEKKTDLKRKYFKLFQKAIPARKTARFFQIENQLNMVLELQVAASLPFIK